MKTAILFPGQGSQSIGMLKELHQHFPSVKALYVEASDTLGFDVWKMSQEDESSLNLTANTQPILLTASIAVWHILQSEKGITADIFAGHSLGEYTALTAAQAFTFSDALRLVQTRGKLMQNAVPSGTGSMAAIIGLDNDIIAEVCEQTQGIVSPANFNSIGQTVIAGSADAVSNACEKIIARGAKRVVPLAVSVPSHCLLMREAADELNQYLSSMDINAVHTPVVSNAQAALLQSPSEIIEALCEQLYLPVRWVENIQLIVNKGVRQSYECGSGNVLSTLVRRIDKQLACLSVNDLLSLEKVNG